MWELVQLQLASQQTVIQSIIPVASFLAGAFVSFRIAMRAVDRNQDMQRILNYSDVMARTYDARPFQSQGHPLSLAQAEAEVEPTPAAATLGLSALKDRAQACKTLPEARDLVVYCIARDPEHLEQFLRNTTRIGTWENRFAFELSLAFEHLAMLCLTGATKLELVLSSNARVIANDYKYCQSFVEQVRNEDPLQQRGTTQAPFRRRHLQWLVAASVLFLHRYYPGNVLETYSSRYEFRSDSLNDTVSLCEWRNREKKLRSELTFELGPNIRFAIEQLLY